MSPPITTDWNNRTKPRLKTFLLKEDMFHLLLEDGGRIVLLDNDWNNRTKPSTDWANRDE